MNCENCGIKISSDFSFAIKNNQCPGCGSSIMKKSKLASYLSLYTLLEENFENIDVERISALIVANFEIKQLFNSGDKKTSKKEEISEVQHDVSEDVEEETGENESSFVKDGIMYEKSDKKRHREILQNLRDQALEGALEDRYGFGFDENLLNEDGTMSRQNIDLMKRQASQQKIESGTGGLFRRG